MLILDRLYGTGSDKQPLPSGWEGTFIGSAQEVTWGALSREIGKYLHSKGLLPTAEVSTFTADDLQNIGPLAGKLLGSNSRPKALRAKRDLGWKPSRPIPEECVAADVEEYLRGIAK
jgi:hypothetical protein